MDHANDIAVQAMPQNLQGFYSRNCVPNEKQHSDLHE